MTGDLEVALIAVIPPTVISLLGVWIAIHNMGAIQNVHMSLNSRLSELLSASIAQGRQEERNAQGIIATAQMEDAKAVRLAKDVKAEDDLRGHRSDK